MIELHARAAPTTANYVLELVSTGRYDGACFYRTSRLGDDGREPLIQGGPLAARFVESPAAPLPAPDIDLLDVLESTSRTGLLHRAGTVSLGRDLFATGHVLPELFICLDDYHDLDEGGRTEPDAHGFPAFGTVADGLDVVAAIARQPAKGRALHPRLEGEALTEPVVIRSARRLEG